jgi:hypothetical protein
VAGKDAGHDSLQAKSPLRNYFIYSSLMNIYVSRMISVPIAKFFQAAVAIWKY